MNGERSVIFDTGVAAIFHTAVLFSVFLLFAGHNAPGGGFAGGLVASAALVLRKAARPDGADGTVSRVRSTTLLGAGLVLAAATGASAWLRGDQFLATAKLSADVPLLGTVKATPALLFDIGVYLVVVGMVLAVIETLSAEEQR